MCKRRYITLFNKMLNIILQVQMNAQQIRSGTRNKLNACVRVSGKEKPVMKQGVLDLWFG